MIKINDILKQKDLIAQEFYEWAESFEHEVDEDGEPTSESYDYIFDLAKKIETEICNEFDLDDIIFHIWQINYNEEKIKL